ncbi:MAG: LLM class flavin-dependent oxidoreductase [Solirubrobacterales bacterium]
MRELHLNAYIRNSGHHRGAWRLPVSRSPVAGDIGHLRRLAEIAERGRLDALFVADGVELLDGIEHSELDGLEPTVMFAALAATTEHVGLIGTMSTSFNSPYNLARRLASLDHVSGGRAGWNIVTSSTPGSAANFGGAPTSHAERYRRAEEFVEVALALWDSWDDDARVVDKGTGVYVDTSRIHAVDHHGEHYDVAGALNVSRSPQGRPLLVQAGTSEPGRRLAARYAEAVFTAQPTLPEAQAFYADLKRRAAEVGRDPDHVLVLPGINLTLGSTVAEATARRQELDELISIEGALEELNVLAGVDLRDVPLDEPIRSLPSVDEIESNKSRFMIVKESALRERLTPREVAKRFVSGGGHPGVVGTPEQVADVLVEWFEGRGADGFNLMGSVLPLDLELFVEHVVPLLVQRGVFRSEYTGSTLRENYGLPPVISDAVGAGVGGRS